MSIDFSNAPFLPMVPDAHYDRNFLQQVVCELRFPTLFELNSNVPPPSFVKAFRKDYPHHQHQLTEMSVNDQPVEQVHVHSFRTRNLDHTVSLRPSAISLETTKYSSFADFKSRLSKLIDVSSKIIDSDFFTRIGIRYINAVPMDINADEKDNLKKFKGWVRHELAQQVIDNDFGCLTDYSSRMNGFGEFGSFSFRHGFGSHTETQKMAYILDYDFWREGVELEETFDVIESLHKHQHAMFDWSLGPKAREYLGPSKYERGNHEH